ncbi:MAG: SDR family oxidoreductase [Bacteroidales bacterium]|jgi:NAD(P)-dependent dehydrogenase (short-subunit alcohol dehydrogenase family)
MKFNPFSLHGKTILITGASSGIGKKCAIECSKMGATIALVARNKNRLIETIELLAPGNHIICPFDVTDYSNIESLVKQIVSKTGLISGFIHSAGIEITLPLNVTKPAHYHDLFNTNVIAAFEFSKIISKQKYYVADQLSIVFIASIMSILGEVAHTAYCSSKGALIGGTKSLALELATKKIRVNSISPAQILGTQITENMLLNYSEKNQIEKLNMYPFGYGKTEDVAYAAIYLLSDAARWVTGTNLIIDGGYSAK